ncbi:carbonic anhydrase [Streptomyces sp. NPDC102279]|uniref:carbonic anhydrase n=1 Tax=Streptomyces sp. NPDC102279 TaxID=3366153 RepID=UPI003814FC28
MQPFIDHARSVGRRPEDFPPLARGRSPQVLFVTCSDSRVVPALITGAGPGRHFELRTADSIVPPCTPGRPTSEAATVEYAVDVPGVREIVVCGHAHRCAVGAQVRGEDLSAVPALRDRPTQAEPPADAPDAPDDDPAVAEAVREHVRTQLLRLRSYPCVRGALTGRRLRPHGWYHEVHTGAVLEHRPDADTFAAL